MYMKIKATITIKSDKNTRKGEIWQASKKVDGFRVNHSARNEAGAGVSATERLHAFYLDKILLKHVLLTPRDFLK